MKFKIDLKKVILQKDLNKLFSICIGEDNQSYISDAQHGALNEFSKHVNVKYQFVLENVKYGILDVVYILTDEMVADMFTKKNGSRQVSQNACPCWYWLK